MNNQLIIPTVSGGFLNLLNPTPAEIRAEDIAHSLANRCTWAGQSRRFYSIAQRSVKASAMAPPHLKRAALFALAWRGYVDTGDFMSEALPDSFRRMIEPLQQAIYSRFNITESQVRACEKYYNYVQRREYHNLIKGVPGKCFHCWEPRQAKAEFLSAYMNLKPSKKCHTTADQH